MDLFFDNPWLLVAAAVLGSAYVGGRSFLTGLRQRRDHRHLDEEGRRVPARVASVEPMQRSLNRAAGHPVVLAVAHGTGYEHTVRDTTGLGGYLLREGAEVTVRQSPTDPDLVRVEEINGPTGPYPVHPPGRDARPSLPAVGAAVLLPLLAAGAGTYLLYGGEPDPAMMLPLFMVLGLVVIAAGAAAAARRRRERGAKTGEAVGVVTDTWTERISTGSRRRGSGGGTRWVHPFTVHFGTHDGREVHTRCPVATSNFRPQPRQQVRVRYDQSYPPRFSVAEVSGGELLTTLLPFIVGTVFTVVGAVGTFVVLFR